MSYQSSGSTEPQAVETLLRPDGMTTEVWLRHDIEKDTAENANGGDVTTYEFWKWQENHLVLPGNFGAGSLDADTLWQQAEDEAKTDTERIADLQAQVEEQSAALMELGDMIGGE